MVLNHLLPDPIETLGNAGVVVEEQWVVLARPKADPALAQPAFGNQP